jgi:hypothetical protein
LTHHAFAGLDEEGANDFIRAFFTARPHYLHYGSPPFVTTSSVTATLEPLLQAFPILLFPIPWEVRLSIPVLDFAPADGVLPPPLVLNPGQFALSTKLTLTILCGANQDGRGGEPIRTGFDIWAIGHVVNNGSAVGFAVDQVEIVDITPDSLESVFNCVLLDVLRSVVSQVSLPIPALSAGFFSLTLEQGPQIDPDELDVWGNV